MPGRALQVRARELRQTSTDAERSIWRHLRNRQLDGWKFRRQLPVGQYFADFACIEAGLIVELDGAQHFEPEAADSDERRSAVLAKLGFTVLRFDDRQALTETEGVLAVIKQWPDLHHPHPNPLPHAGEGANASARNTP